MHTDRSARQVATNGAGLQTQSAPEFAGEGGGVHFVVLAVAFVNSLGPRSMNSPRTCSATVEERGLGRWQKLLGCATAKSFALFLLHLAPNGCDGARSYL